MAGGGGDAGGTVVGGPSPQGAYLAGMFQQQAAAEASRQAEAMINEAIGAINKNYQQARYDVQPYRTEGVQALNQLNQYLGLKPYNPGPAPNAPDAPTLENYKGKVDDSDIANYITSKLTYFPQIQNGRAVEGSNRIGYGGAYTKDGVFHPTGSQWTASATTFANPASFLMTQDQIRQGAIDAVAREQLKQAQAQYPDQLLAHQRDLTEYNQNLDMYNQYSQEGPLTSAQISDRIANLPGYQSELGQGIDAISKSAAARGALGSGALLKELSRYGQGTMSKYYNNELDRLAQLAGGGQQAATTSAQSALGTGQNIGSLYANLGDTKANASLAAGNAISQALLAANQQYKIIGGGGGGGGLGGLGSVLGGIGSIMGSMPSSKELKTELPKRSTKDIVEKVKALDINKWKYKEIPVAHLGPYAEDFKETFGVGDGQSINLIDYLGVLLASVKELAHQVDELKRVK